MAEPLPTDPIPYRKVFETLSAIAGIFALPYAVSLPLRDFKFVDNQYSAGIMVLIAIITSLVLLAGVEAFHRWLGAPGLAANGGRGYVAMALLAVVFTCYGFFANCLIGPASQHPSPKKPTTVKFADQLSASKLLTPELMAYRNALTNVNEPEKYFPMIETVPYSQPVAPHVFSVGPGEIIDTGFAFLVPADQGDSIRILKVGHESGAGSDLTVAVPAANPGDCVLLLLRTNRDAKLYPGEVK
jgi:hypothetical protein